MRTHAVDMLQLAYGGRVFKQRKMHGTMPSLASAHDRATVCWRLPCLPTMAKPTIAKPTIVKPHTPEPQAPIPSPQPYS